MMKLYNYYFYFIFSKGKTNFLNSMNNLLVHIVRKDPVELMKCHRPNKNRGRNSSVSGIKKKLINKLRVKCKAKHA